uniref:Uncharacterized protein n=1 Tax=Timspurckia oligopyrenoides TaxID=708627 RepID=A0A7S0ZFN7_9RHOD|mmetsp:Transcript_3518/g.6157  ORF Transcript_3518/g.6157 Transcript_3518/m.6157 type:complete len:195 (+) Transcript_3518:1211-1795(+)|eukprot:CAMPEP_0182447458 /NCGR_PEP_ID=MMETSP1172-20130603/16254_1 /TAXON_ID=708627 /ORGANISM="Timspurckia oligopyrenoides, Strain CCMP3278" /LENGTH=194 /DNA_ID=CAMNT_0024643903 /DNA_START=1132 /DNA_END=1716 /DNA_ORIENTATION=-
MNNYHTTTTESEAPGSEPMREDSPAPFVEPSHQVKFSQTRHRKRWTEEENESLREHVNKNGPKNWAQIASHFPGRSNHQVRLRYHNYLKFDNAASDRPYTSEDDELILRIGSEGGRQWSIAARDLDRSNNAIKNRFFLLQRRSSKSQDDSAVGHRTMSDIPEFRAHNASGSRSNDRSQTSQLSRVKVSALLNHD